MDVSLTNKQKRKPPMDDVDSCLSNKPKRKRTQGPKILEQAVHKWTDLNKDDVDQKVARKPPAKGSKKGCMRGKGGPDNTKFNFRGVRQRTSGKWVVEIREPNGGKKLWLGTFGSALEGALAYDKAARAMYGASARLNLPSSPLLSETSTTCGSNLTFTSQTLSEKSSQVGQSHNNVSEASASSSEVVNDDPEHDMIDVDYLFREMDREPIIANEAGYDAWYNFDFLETEPEDCNFSLDDLLRSF